MGVRRLLSLTLCLTGLASHAMACPGAEAMNADGVWIRTEDGGKIHYQRQSEDVILETAYFPGDAPVQTESHLGLYFLRDGAVKNGEIDPDTVTRWRYPDLAAVPDPNSSGKWSETVEVLVPGAESAVKDRVAIRRSPASLISIGDCRYRARTIFVKVAYGDGGVWVTQYLYLVELGFGVLVAAGKTAKTFEFEFKPIAISATEP